MSEAPPRHSPAFLALVDAVRARVVETDVEDVRSRLQAGEPFHLLDVREDREWAQGRIPGARHLGRGVIERDIEAVIPDRDADIVLYCGGGYRSALAADSLARMGYTGVRSMAGGFRAWTGAGHPVERGSGRAAAKGSDGAAVGGSDGAAVGGSDA